MVAVPKEPPMRHRRVWIAAVFFILLLSSMVFMIGVPGCDSGNEELHNCPDPESGIYDPNCCGLFNVGCAVPCVVPGSDLALCCEEYAVCETDTVDCGDWWQIYCGPDAGTDTDGATGCAGDCVPLPPDDWSAPQLFWTGPAGSTADCPSNAPVTAFRGFSDPGEPPEAGCTACSCDRSSPGSCAPPTHIFASALPCDAGAPLSAPFDPPAGWNGGCTTNEAVTAGASCGGSPCVASIVAGPMVDNGCVPSQATPVDAGPPGWGTAAVACVGTLDPLGACADHGETCTPSAPPSSGFLTCIFEDGDNPCPDGSPYSDRYVVYTSFDDERGCTACGCGAPDFPCTAELGVFQDNMCDVALLDAGISSVGPSCFDLPDAGLALGSKEVALAHHPGSCPASGGEPTDGGFAPSGAATFCCLAVG
jgi:hypothetical protein